MKIFFAVNKTFTDQFSVNSRVKHPVCHKFESITTACQPYFADDIVMIALSEENQHSARMMLNSRNECKPWQNRQVYFCKKL